MLIVFTKIMDFFKLGFCLFPFNLHAIDINRLKAYVGGVIRHATDIKRLKTYIGQYDSSCYRYQTSKGVCSVL